MTAPCCQLVLPLLEIDENRFSILYDSGTRCTLVPPCTRTWCLFKVEKQQEHSLMALRFVKLKKTQIHEHRFKGFAHINLLHSTSESSDDLHRISPSLLRAPVDIYFYIFRCKSKFYICDPSDSKHRCIGCYSITGEMT